MTRVRPAAAPGDPFAGVERVLVDGTNLLHRLSRGPERQPPAALIGRLRAAIPATAQIELVFDGPPDRGTKGARIASGLTVRYAGRFSADTVLITLVEETAIAASGSPTGPGADRVLVISDDRDLRHELQRRGARTAGSAWLIGRLERTRLAAPTSGNARPPGGGIGAGRTARPGGDPNRSGHSGQPDGDDDGREPWRPGRGATAKTGNGRRAPRATRRMPS